MSTRDFTTFGEGQIRLTVQRGARLRTAQDLKMTAAGSEANVAGVLAQLDHTAMWASMVPRGDLGDRILTEYRAVGVDLSRVVRTDSGRVALYFLEPGDDPMPAKVTYDRLHTPFRDITPDTFDWDTLLDTRMLFVTGITAALTPNTAAVVRYAIDAAHERGVTVAADVNHRTMLWSEDDAQAFWASVTGKLDLLFCSRTDGNRVFGITGDGVQVSRGLRDRTGVRLVVTTDHSHGVCVSSDSHEQKYDITHVPVVDRPGAGDAFIGGCLDGYLSGDIDAGIRTGISVSRFALTHHGDLTHLRRGDIELPISQDIVR